MNRLVAYLAVSTAFATPAWDATASAIEHTQLVLSSGTELGVGGGPQGGFGFVKVCDATKINAGTLPVIVHVAMNSLDSTLQADVLDSTASNPTVSWKTALTSVGPIEIQGYNSATEISGQLPEFYKYYYTSDGRISLDDGIVTVQTIISLYIGNTPVNTELYNGPYSGKFFHNRIIKALTEGASELSCQ
jgi:hypothetical protein